MSQNSSTHNRIAARHDDANLLHNKTLRHHRETTAAAEGVAIPVHKHRDCNA
ncbi:MAG: hypothetical protein SFU57_06325 [Gemmatimonadales bacterium]|nr:hypothetical protein [Gemmatimonadales bacterium]